MQNVLGYIIDQNELKPDPAKVRVVVEWPEPTDCLMLLQFLVFTNFYCRFK